MLAPGRASSSLDAYEALRDAAPVFAALGDDTRLRLVASLSDGVPRSIRELTAATDVTRQAVTKHLQTLSAAGLVTGTKAGREHHWRLEPQQLERARASLEALEQQWDRALHRLKAALEAEVSSET